MCVILVFMKNEVCGIEKQIVPGGPKTHFIAKYKGRYAHILSYHEKIEIPGS